jgi:hypothetical protein
MIILVFIADLHIEGFLSNLGDIIGRAARRHRAGWFKFDQFDIRGRGAAPNRAGRRQLVQDYRSGPAADEIAYLLFAVMSLTGYFQQC